LKIHLYILDTEINLDWTVDLDTPHITFVAKGEDVFGEDISKDSYDKDISSVEESH
jgi:hypothetical protein